MVGYDSIIPPGRVGTVTESVNLSNYHGGSYTKSASIMSNAKNSPSMQISIRWVIKAYISASPSMIELIKDKNGDFKAEVTLTSEKAKLKVTEVEFRANEEKPANASGPAWQNELPVQISCFLEKDTLKKDGYRDYIYKLSAKVVGVEKKTGDFVFKTNHENAPELKVSGMVDPGR